MSHWSDPIEENLGPKNEIKKGVSINKDVVRPVNPKRALDVDDLIQRSLMAGEGIISLKEKFKEVSVGPIRVNLPSKDNALKGSYSHRRAFSIDCLGLGEISSFFDEEKSLSTVDVKEVIKKIAERQMKSHLLRIQDELKSLESCLEEMSYKYLSLKASYACKDLKQISDALAKKEDP